MIPLSFCTGLKDPGNLEGDLQMGATTGYKLLWLLALASFLVGGGTFSSIFFLASIGMACIDPPSPLCVEDYPSFCCFDVWYDYVFVVHWYLMKPSRHISDVGVGASQGFLVQICALKIGTVTGIDLSQMCRYGCILWAERVGVGL